MQNDHQRKKDHELGVLCFVTNGEHGDVRTQRTADKPKQQQRFFRNSPEMFDSAAFIDYGYNRSCEIDDDKVNKQALDQK